MSFNEKNTKKDEPNIDDIIWSNLRIYLSSYIFVGDHKYVCLNLISNPVWNFIDRVVVEIFNTIFDNQTTKAKR